VSLTDSQAYRPARVLPSMWLFLFFFFRGSPLHDPLFVAFFSSSVSSREQQSQCAPFSLFRSFSFWKVFEAFPHTLLSFLPVPTSRERLFTVFTLALSSISTFPPPQDRMLSRLTILSHRPSGRSLLFCRWFSQFFELAVPISFLCSVFDVSTPVSAVWFGMVFFCFL